MKKATLSEMARRTFFEQMKDVNTAIPARVISFDPETQLAQIQFAIERVDRNGNSSPQSPIIRCPVHFPGGEWLVEYQIDADDEGLAIISQRCIDAWIDQGGVAPQAVVRFHDRNDAFFIPGTRSQPKKISNFENNGVKMRSRTGNQSVWLKNDGTVEITAEGFNVNSPTFTHNGTNVGETHKHIGNLGTPTGDPID